MKNDPNSLGVLLSGFSHLGHFLQQGSSGAVFHHEEASSASFKRINDEDDKERVYRTRNRHFFRPINDILFSFGRRSRFPNLLDDHQRFAFDVLIQ